MEWHDYTTGKSPGEHTVVGTLYVAHQIYSPQLDNQREVFVYLPPSYAQSDRRYPVLYMHDGQNLFDEALSYAGEWRIDEMMEQLSHEGIEVIVVGVAHGQERRMNEYNPFDNRRFGKG